MLTELNNQDNFNKYRYLLVDNLVVLNSLSPLSRDSLLDLFGEDKPFGEKKLTQVLRTDLDYDQSICPTLIKLADPNDLFAGLQIGFLMKSANKPKLNVYGLNAIFVLILSLISNRRYWQNN